MNTEMLDLVKALSDPTRLRIIGALSKGPQTVAQVAATTSLTVREAFNHLAFLEFVHVVVAHAAEKKQDETYALDDAFLSSLAKQTFEGQKVTFQVSADENEETRRILKKYLDPDGRIRQIPNTRTQMAAFRVILNYVLSAFEQGRNYTEHEVNEILKRYHEDIAGLRRDLVDAGLLRRERDGSRYWRTEDEKRPA